MSNLRFVLIEIDSAEAKLYDVAKTFSKIYCVDGFLSILQALPVRLRYIQLEWT